MSALSDLSGSGLPLPCGCAGGEWRVVPRTFTAPPAKHDKLQCRRCHESWPCVFWTAGYEAEAWRMVAKRPWWSTVEKPRAEAAVVTRGRR